MYLSNYHTVYYLKKIITFLQIYKIIFFFFNLFKFINTDIICINSLKYLYFCRINKKLLFNL